MPGTRVCGQTFQPLTCFCVLKQGIYREGSDWSTVTVTNESIVRTCEGHAAFTTPDDLMAAIRPENQTYSRAVQAVRQDGTAKIRLWYVDQVTRVVTMEVVNASESLQAILDAISGLSVSYTEA